MGLADPRRRRGIWQVAVIRAAMRHVLIAARHGQQDGLVAMGGEVLRGAAVDRSVAYRK